MKIKLTTLFLAALLISCSNEAKIEKLTLSADNPFNRTLNKPIAYANIKADDIEAYVNITITNAVVDLDNIKTTDNLSFENTFEVYDRISSDLSKAYSNAFMLNWVSTDSLTRAKGVLGYQKIDSLFTDIGSDKALYNPFNPLQIQKKAQLLKAIKKHWSIKF